MAILHSGATVRFAALLLLVSTQSAPAASDESPEAFVRRVYALYRTHDSPGVPMERPGGAAFYAAPLLDLFARERKWANGEVGVIDSDPLCACQDFDKLRVKSVAVGKVDADIVKARVAIGNLGSNYTVTLTLTRTPAGWRIADVGDKDWPSLVAAVEKAIAQPAEPDAASPTQKR